MPSLHAVLSKDKLGVAELTNIYDSSVRSGDFLRELTAELSHEDETTLPLASWLLYRYSTDHTVIAAKTLQVAIEVAANTNSWKVRLHVCHLFSRVTCPSEMIEPLFELLVKSAHDRRPFIRAWALNSLHCLQSRAPNYRREIEELLQIAQSDPSKSVQARLRRIQVERKPRARERA